MLSLNEIYKYAKKGVAEWQYFLGKLYEYGDIKQGISKDIMESLYWYKLASNRGHSLALNKYGIYSYRHGCHNIAYKYLKKSYLLGSIVGKYNYYFFILNHPEYVNQSYTSKYISKILLEFKKFKKDVNNLNIDDKNLNSKLDTLITSLQLFTPLKI
jgi:TPR repeat protein